MATDVAKFETSQPIACVTFDMSFSQTCATRLPQRQGGRPGILKFLVILAASIMALTSARAEQCDRNPTGLGTSRTIVVDPTRYPRIGTMSYPEIAAARRQGNHTHVRRWTCTSLYGPGPRHSCC